MAEIFLVITEPDYEGFSVVEAHLTRESAEARVAAANEYAKQAPEFPEDDEGDAGYAQWSDEYEAWRKAHPFGYEVSGGYVQQGYTVMAKPIGPAPTQADDAQGGEQGATPGRGGDGGEVGDCGNAERNWRGQLDECSYIRAVGPCCPKCREIVEPDADGVRGTAKENSNG